jgi:hypothetical protein
MNNIEICNDKNEKIGTIYKEDISEEGGTIVYVWEYYDDINKRKRLKYSSSKKEYEEAIREINK